MNKKLLLLIFILLIGQAKVKAQTATDDLLMKKYEFCFAVLRDKGKWDQYWEGTYLRGNANIGTFSRVMVMPMMTFGITNKLNLILATPYVKTESDGGQLAGVKGFQDLNVALKYEVLKKQLGKGKLQLLTSGGFSTPMTNYLSDYMPYSLGLGTNEYFLRAIAHYQLDKGIYGRIMGGYLWRTRTQVERDYYYNNGSYYTRYMDVPNAFQFQATVGSWFFKHALKVETIYSNFKCLSGDDIRAYNAPQPTNKVEVEQLSVFAQYFFKQYVKGLGVLGSWSQMINGRNMGKFINIGFGVSYQFSAKKESKTE